jgi:hypothetical protein
MKRKPVIPSLATIKKGIDELILVDKWDNYSIKKSPRRFEKRLNELLISKLGLIPYVIYLGSDKSIPKTYFRVREKTRTFNEKLISEYSYPPNHFVKTAQRANIPYHPVFYCSDNPATAIQETYKDEDKANDKTVYYMSEWTVKDDQDVKVCPFIFDNVADTNPYRNLSEINKTKLFEQMKEQTEDEKKGTWEVLKFLSNLFTYENTYVVSSYLAYINLYAPHEFRPDVFIYPSFQTQKTTVNFAFHPNAVIEKLRLNRVFKLRLTNFNKQDNSFTMSISWVGHNKNGIILWTQIDDNTEKGREAIKELDTVFIRVP